jgi:hypothetical protein
MESAIKIPWLLIVVALAAIWFFCKGNDTYSLFARRGKSYPGVFVPPTPYCYPTVRV